MPVRPLHQAAFSPTRDYRGFSSEFGSGTCKHASALSSFGFTVHGIERSASMVAQASLLMDSLVSKRVDL